MSNEATLSEIIEAVRDGERPGYEDLRYAICALEALATFASGSLRKLREAELESKPPRMMYSAEWQYREHWERTRRAGNTPPKKYIGWNYDPDNPEFLARRKSSQTLVERIIAREASETESGI